MKRYRSIFAVALVILLPLTASAHRFWLLPSQTVLSGADPWVTVDAAISNDLFYFNHYPLRLDGLVVTDPQGEQAAAENKSTGRYRSVFDLQLAEEGTYRIAVANDGMFASWTEGEERRRWRGSAEDFATEVPRSAEDLSVVQSSSRVETFVTNGAPNKTALQSVGAGLEVVMLTHPNDLYAGEVAEFRLLADGEPAAGQTVEFVRGGTRYRDTTDIVTATTDRDGRFSVSWDAPGMYYLETSLTDDQVSLPDATRRRLTYAATLEVLPQ